MWGAVVLTNSKELSNQIYSLAWRLDIKQRLRMNRIGSSIQTTSPIVEHLTPESTKKDKREYKDDSDTVSLKNMINNSVWEKNDLVFTTPAIMKFIVEQLSTFEPYDINPGIIAVDEFDVLFSNPGIAENMQYIVRKFAGS